MPKDKKPKSEADQLRDGYVEAFSTYLYSRAKAAALNEQNADAFKGADEYFNTRLTKLLAKDAWTAPEIAELSALFFCLLTASLRGDDDKT